MTTPGPYRLANGEFLRCVVCGATSFTLGHAQLNRWLTTWFGLDWLDPSAHLAICESCGYVHWFTKAKSSGVEPVPFTRKHLGDGESGEGAPDAQ